MTSLKSKYSPYIESQAFLFYDTSSNSKSAVKSSDSISAIRPKAPTIRSITSNARVQVTMSIPTRLSTEENFNPTKMNSQDIALRTFNRQTLSILQTIKTNRPDGTPKQTPKIRLKSETASSGPIQLNVRCNTASERKSGKGFRIRGNTLANPAYIPLFETVKLELNKKTQVSKVGSLPSVDAEPSVTNTKTPGLERMCFNILNQARIDLPLLIVHFEGVLGSCLIANKEAKGHNTTDGSDETYFFVKKDVKEELKQLSRNFLIAIVFPSFNNRYKTAMQHFLNKKYCFDGIYYKAENTGVQGTHRILDFMLDYNMIIADFKARKASKKVVILLPLTLHRSIIKDALLPQEKSNRTTRQGMLDKSCFLHFFPRINVETSNLKVVCLPNFLLEDKNEKFSNLAKAKISAALKAVVQILNTFGTREKEHENVLISQDRESIHSTLPTPSNKENETEEQQHHQPVYKTIHGRRFVNNNRSSSTEIVKPLQLNEVIQELEKVRQFNIKFRKIEEIKESNGIIRGQSTHVFDLGLLRQKMIEDLADIQRNKRSNMRGSTPNTNNKVSIVSVVGGLFNNNVSLFKAYEKDDFYSSRKGASIISDITKCMERKEKQISARKKGENEGLSTNSMCEAKEELETNRNGDDELEIERRSSMPNCLTKEKPTKGKKRGKTSEKQKFVSHSTKAKIIEDQEEVLALQQIKRLAGDINIYFDE